MEETLRRLYELQKIDTNLDELEELKGDLPAEVKELEETMENLRKELESRTSIMKQAFADRDIADSEIVALKQKVERYKTQQLEVRNNKEYDALTKEMDNAVSGIAKLEKEMESLEGIAITARTDIEDLKKKLAEINGTVDEKRVALTEVSKETEAEEDQFKKARTKAVENIKRSFLHTYQRIRDSKRGGKAIVPLIRGACGGCFNLVPPQKVLELRQNKYLYMCEHCGRILVSDEISAGNGTPA